ncbi:MAG: hypothetical protein RSF86_13565 [Angelakisella sp.]
MNELFAQGRGSTSIEVNRQSMARDFGVRTRQVAYFKAGIDLSLFRVLYDEVTQRAYFLPSGLAAGTTAVTLLTSGVLTHSAGTVDLGEYAAQRGEYFHTGFTFGDTYTLETHNQTIRFGAGRYRWAGVLPKIMAPADNPVNAGGIKPGAWVLIPAETITTPTGGNIADWMKAPHIMEFTNRAGYATELDAINAALEYARDNAPHILNCTGYVSNRLTAGRLVAENVTLHNGEFVGDRDFWHHNCTFRGTTFRDMRIMPKGGDLVYKDCYFLGHPRAGQAGAVVFQHLWHYDLTIPGATDAEKAANASFTDAGTFEMDGCVFRDGYFGILQQGSGGKIDRMILRNLSFHSMKGDAIELNVVQNCFDDGCIIENIVIFDIDGSNAPIPVSNWGIGIGVAGKGPYGWAATEDQYCKNVTIRNVFADRVRQVVHFEVGRNLVVTNIHANPSNKVSVGTGLSLGAVYMYGCKEFVIDGVYGEPDVATQRIEYPLEPGKFQEIAKAEDIRLISLEWGNNAPKYDEQGGLIPPPPGMVYGPACPCNNYVVRNVVTKTGRFYAGVSAGLDGNQKEYPNRVILENIDAYKLTVFGVASELNMSNINSQVFNCIGQYSSADGLTGDGWWTFQRSLLNMTNVNASTSDRIARSQGWLRCRYSEVNITGSNVTAIPYSNFIGANGVPVGSMSRSYFPGEADHGQNGTRFPTGRQFNYGDTVFVMELQRSMMTPNPSLTSRDDMRDKSKYVATDVYVNTPYIVTSPGVFIPDTEEAGIKAVAAGARQLVQNLTPDATSKGSPWLYVCQFSPGTRIIIPGAGVGGADLETYVIKSPYQTPATNVSAPITMDIAHAIVTGVAAGTRIRAAEPVQTRPALTKARSAYWSISQL